MKFPDIQRLLSLFLPLLLFFTSLIIMTLYYREDTESCKHVTISIIPCGTGNTVAYDLGIVSVEDAIQKAIEGKKRVIDVASETCSNEIHSQCIYIH